MLKISTKSFEVEIVAGSSGRSVLVRSNCSRSLVIRVLLDFGQVRLVALSRIEANKTLFSFEVFFDFSHFEGSALTGDSLDEG